MGKNYIYRCEECSKKYETSGPWSFYWDKGERIPYGYPGPYSRKAELKGIDGTFADVLCLNCGKEVNVILDQFHQPMRKFSLFNFVKKNENRKEEKNKCPYCNSEDLFLSHSEAETNEIICPKCHSGNLNIEDEWFPGED